MKPQRECEDEDRDRPIPETRRTSSARIVTTIIRRELAADAPRARGACKRPAQADFSERVDSILVIESSKMPARTIADTAPVERRRTNSQARSVPKGGEIFSSVLAGMQCRRSSG